MGWCGMRHLPTFTGLSAWEHDPTAACIATCTCGWESQWCRDQTAAEYVHGLHLVAEGVIPQADFDRDQAIGRNQ